VSGQHPDVHWLRAESKLRQIRIAQVRELGHAIYLKPTEARYKVGIVLGADRMNPESANAFLKTLEEPPTASLLILTSTEPDRVLETILSRCLRLVFPGGGTPAEEDLGWLREFVALLEQPPRSLLARYHLLDVLLRRLAELRAAVESEITARSPAKQHQDVDADLREQWETEQKAAVEAEFRLRRGQTLGQLQAWFRDVWALTVGLPGELLAIPSLAGPAETVARRLDSARAVENLGLLERTQSLLHTNVQEALALEVAMLRLHV
jgi:DNA polymerase-3 subunit delta'